MSWTDRRSGHSQVILMNLNSKKGKVYTDGIEVTDVKTRDQFLERARRAWINDTYWLLMPYKLFDPGVELTYSGEEVINGTTYDILHLSFNDVGVTPGDEYWAYINRETSLMDKWVYLLQLREGQTERSRGEWKWNSWRRYGKILLSSERERVDGQKRMHKDLAVFQHVDKVVFTSWSPVTPKLLYEHTDLDISEKAEEATSSYIPVTSKPAKQLD